MRSRRRVIRITPTEVQQARRQSHGRLRDQICRIGTALTTNHPQPSLSMGPEARGELSRSATWVCPVELGGQ